MAFINDNGDMIFSGKELLANLFGINTDNLPIMAKEVSPWPYELDPSLDCKPLEKCKFSKPYCTSKELEDWIQSINMHFTYVQTIKKGVAEIKTEKLKEMASLGIVDMDDVKASFKKELEILADYRSRYLKKIDAAIQKGALASIEDPKTRKRIYGELLKLMDENQFEEMTFNGKDGIEAPIPNVAIYRKHLVDAFNGIRKPMSEQELEKMKKEQEAASEKKKQENAVAKRYEETKKKCDALVKAYEKKTNEQSAHDIEIFTSERLQKLKTDIAALNTELKSVGVFAFSQKKLMRRKIEKLTAELNDGKNAEYIQKVCEHIKNRADEAVGKYKKTLDEYMNKRFTEKERVLRKETANPRPKTRSEKNLDNAEQCMFMALGNSYWRSVAEVREYIWEEEAHWNPYKYATRLYSYGLLDRHNDKYALAGTPYDIMEKYWVEKSEMAEKPIPSAPQVESFLTNIPKPDGDV